MQYAVPEARQIGPHHIDNFLKKTDGVWYADDRNIRMVWYGGKSLGDSNAGKAFNPFQIAERYSGEKSLHVFYAISVSFCHSLF